jgi:hypothetical protein
VVVKTQIAHFFGRNFLETLYKQRKIQVHEKVYALIAKWEEEWQDLESEIIEKDRKFPGGCLTTTQTRKKAIALDFRKRIDELTTLVKE